MQTSLAELSATVLAAIIVPQMGSSAPQWSVEPVAMPAPVTEIRQTGEGVFAWAGRWYALSYCEETLLCAGEGEPAPRETADDGIPGGFVATADGGDGIQRAWYAAPADRHPDSVLGDGIAAGSLLAEDVFGRQYRLDLGPGEVFEDMTPRIVDIDGDGNNEIIAIRTSLTSGTSVSVYGISASRLALRTATTPVGRGIWLNIAGIADFVGTGRLNVAIVTDPDGAGRLELLNWNRNRFETASSADGFSNHVSGSAEQDMASVASVDGDRIPELVLPGAERTSLRMMTAAGGRFRQVMRMELPGAVTTAIGRLDGPRRPVFALGLDDGSLVAVGAR